MQREWLNNIDICIFIYEGSVKAAKQLFEEKFLSAKKELTLVDAKIIVQSINFSIYTYVSVKENISLDDCCYTNALEIEKQGINFHYLLQIGLNIIQRYGYATEYLVKKYKNKNIQSMLYFIHSHITGNICIDTLAKEVGLSKNYAIFLFKKEVGLTPQQYIIKRRTTLVKNLLVYSSLSVESIALMCGFQSQSYLSTCFKKETTYTPLQYKKKYK